MAAPKVSHKLILLNIMVCNDKDKKAYSLSRALDLSSFNWLMQGQAKQYIIFSARTASERVQNGSRVSVALEKIPYTIHTYKRVDGLCGIAITDQDYSHRVAHSVITTMLIDFEKQFGNVWKKETQDKQYNFKLIDKLLVEYQDPNKDKLFALHNDLDEIKEITQNNLSDLLERGENLDKLIQQSDDIGQMAKQFQINTKQGCCYAI